MIKAKLVRQDKKKSFIWKNLSAIGVFDMSRVIISKVGYV